MPATIRDVARKAGVGLGTVSRVINQSPQVSEATRLRVQQAIEELDFHPSPIARRLSLQKTLTIAAVAPFFTRPSVIERLRGVELTISGTQYDLIIYNVETVERQEAILEALTRPERSDGVLLITLAPSKEQLERFKAAGIPMALIDVNNPQIDSVNRVTVDDECGGWQATTHLLELGHEKIAYISDPLSGLSDFSASRQRYEGYLRALQEAGINADERYHLHGEASRYGARELAGILLELPDPPTAIFAASDTQAIGVLEAARGRGLKVPQELSIIGYDNIEIADHLGLTTVHQQLFDSGAHGVWLLLKAIEEPDTPILNDVLATEVIVRRTTGRAPG